MNIVAKSDPHYSVYTSGSDFTFPDFRPPPNPTPSISRCAHTAHSAQCSLLSLSCPQMQPQPSRTAFPPSSRYFRLSLSLFFRSLVSSLFLFSSSTLHKYSTDPISFLLSHFLFLSLLVDRQLRLLFCYGLLPHNRQPLPQVILRHST